MVVRIESMGARLVEGEMLMVLKLLSRAGIPNQSQPIPPEINSPDWDNAAMRMAGSDAGGSRSVGDLYAVKALPRAAGRGAGDGTVVRPSLRAASATQHRGAGMPGEQVIAPEHLIGALRERGETDLHVWRGRNG